MKNCILFIILLFIFHFSFAQKEASHWYFGNKAGLDFSSGSPVLDSKGSLNTLEGCATISDINGNLLFYSDGSVVWNRNHSIMPNGTPLAGNSSSTQSAIIVPKPEDQNLYFIFTVDWSNGKSGLNYYTIDMRLDGGLGDVISANNAPVSTRLLESPMSEKINAVKVLNEDAFWVVSLKEDRFYVFKVGSFGVSSQPVNGNDGFRPSVDSRGYLKISPDGTKMISANMTSGTFLYDFDSKTGIVTNERQLNVLSRFSYGAEFSPSSKKLYLSTGNFDAQGTPAQENLFQFTLDIDDPTSANLNATRVNLHTYTNQRAALQLALDGKIYRAIDNEPFLGVINNPEGDGFAANYVHKAISLGSKISKQGLPPFIQSFFIANILVDNQCLGDETIFTINSNEPIVSIVWDFGDGSPKSIEENPSHTYGSSGIYRLTVVITTEDEVEKINQNITIFDLPDVLTPITMQQCDDDTDGISIFDLRQSEELISDGVLTNTYSYYLKYEDAEEKINPIDNPSSFSNADGNIVFVRVENQVECYSIAKLNLEVSTTTIPVDFMIEFYECDNDLIDGDDSNGITNFSFSYATQEILDLFPPDQDLNVGYYDNMLDALLQQNEIDSNAYRNESSPFSQELIVRVDNRLNKTCVGLGQHLTLKVASLPEFDLVEHEILCLNTLPDPLVIKVNNPEGLYIYEWRNEKGTLLTTNTSSILEVTVSGEYYVTAITDLNCERTKKITIEDSNTARVENVDIIDATDRNSIDVHVSGEGDYEFSLNEINGPYQDDGFFEIAFGGVHTVYIKDKNSCGIVSHQVVVLNIPKFFTPNGDGINDSWQVNGVFSQPNSKIYIFDRFGKILNQIGATTTGWDGNYNGNPLPSSDYWYMVQLEDGRILKGHFSLIRR